MSFPNRIAGVFAAAVNALYQDLPTEFATWLHRREHLVVCWVMGFKPRGDDARPDRGLPPFTRMLAGRRHDLLTVVYGPAPEGTWPLLVNAPQTLADRNGLWEAILVVSDALLVDAKTDRVTNRGFVRANWIAAIRKPQPRSILVSSMPERLGENDVDTVLHTLLARCAGPRVFEGICNPPGGDWSGVSLQTADRSMELRWLSLPRVSGAKTKRPDHVFQVFGLGQRPIVLSVESKETPAAVEPNIGGRLVAYVRNLIASPASIERPSGTALWEHSIRRLSPREFDFVSAVAYIACSAADLENVSRKARAQLILAFDFAPGGSSCTIALAAAAGAARRIAQMLLALSLAGTGIEVRLAQ